MPVPLNHSPIRSSADIAALESAPLEQRLGPGDVAAWLEAGHARDPQRVAISYLSDANPETTPQTLSHGALRSRARQAARLFRELGVTRQDTVLLLLPTLPQWFVATLGAIKVGRVCCANWMLSGEQWLDLVRSSRARVIVTLGPAEGFDIWERLCALRDRLPRDLTVLAVNAQVLGNEGHIIAGNKFGNDSRKPRGNALDPALDFDRRLDPFCDDPFESDPSPAAADSVAFVHSGGTTGAPKLIPITQRNLTYKLWANSVIEARSAADTVFADYPMFHIAGMLGRALLPLANGSGVLIASPLGARDRRFIDNYWRLIERHHVSFLSGVPTTLSVLANHPPTREDLSSLRGFMTTGSTALSPDIARRIEAMTGVHVLLTYGATEYTMNISPAPRDGQVRYGSAGIRIPYSDIRALRLDGQGQVIGECGVDEIGTIALRGPGITQAPGAQWHEDWFISGDLGRIDAAGYLWITGRSRDLIIRGGHNIDPRMIEDALRRHPGVLHVAAVGKPDAHAGELPVAYVQAVPDTQLDVAELQQFAQREVPERAAVPKEIYLIEQMPLTDVGKPFKLGLREASTVNAFTSLLTALVGPDANVGVQCVSDPAHGTRVEITIAAGSARTRLEPAVDQALAAFAIRTDVRWV